MSDVAFNTTTGAVNPHQNGNAGAVNDRGKAVKVARAAQEASTFEEEDCSAVIIKVVKAQSIALPKLIEAWRACDLCEREIFFNEEVIPFVEAAAAL
jgi:hypothetical protein